MIDTDFALRSSIPFDHHFDSNLSTKLSIVTRLTPTLRDVSFSKKRNDRRRVVNLLSSSGSRIHGRTACDSRHKPPQREFEFSLGQGQASVGPALNFEIAISTKSEKNEQTPKTRRNRGRQPDKNNRHTNQQFLARGPAAAATKDISALDK